MNSQNRHRINQTVEIFFFLLGIAIYIWIMTADFPRSTRDFMGWLSEEKTVVLLGVILFYLIAHQIPGSAGRSIRWIGLVSLFGVFLRGYWIIKRTAFFQIFGLLPYVDASEYYSNALRLLMGFPAQGTTIGRPLYSSFFAGLLWISQYNLQTALIIQVGMVAASLHLLQESIRRHFGILPAATVTSFTFMFYRNYLGGVSSETLGLIFACLGWAFLFDFFEKESFWRYLTGLFLLTLGLLTRAGPFFILPFIWLAIILIKKDKSTRIQYTVGALAVIALGFGINSLALNVLSQGQSYMFPNYLYSVYGMAAGGRGWSYIKEARPDLMALAEPFRTQQIGEATKELIQAQPFVFLWNFLKQYWYFVLYGNTSLFSYLFTSIDWFNLGMMGVLYALCLYTFIRLIKDHKDVRSMTLFLVIIGILLSVPFVPPQDESNMRAFAVSVPFMALIPAIGAQWLLQKIAGNTFLKRLEKKPEPLSNSTSFASLGALGISAILFFCTFYPAFFLNRVDQPEVATVPHCLDGETPIIWRNVPANNILLKNRVDDNGVNYISELRKERLMHDIYKSESMPLFQSFQPPLTITEQMNSLDGRSGWMLISTDVELSTDGYYAGCGTWYPSDDFYLFDFVRISSAEPVDQ